MLITLRLTRSWILQLTPETEISPAGRRYKDMKVGGGVMKLA